MRMIQQIRQIRRRRLHRRVGADTEREPGLHAV